MIIGGGLIASKFLEQKELFENHIVFASGVSDSSETDESAYHREIELVSNILNENSDLSPIYFSCVLVDVSRNRYYDHKLEMEKLIKDKTDKYVIFRVPQIVGRGGNKNNLFNSFKHSINNNNLTKIYANTERSIIDVDDLVEIVKRCMWDYQNTLTISNIERISSLSLYQKMAVALNRIPWMIEAPTKENTCVIINNSDLIDYAIDYLEIQREGYTNNVIQKYVR